MVGTHLCMYDHIQGYVWLHTHTQLLCEVVEVTIIIPKERAALDEDYQN